MKASGQKEEYMTTPNIEIRPQLLKEGEARRYLGNISHSTLWELRQEGVIPTIRIGAGIFFSIEDLDSYISGLRDKKKDGRKFIDPRRAERKKVIITDKLLQQSAARDTIIASAKANPTLSDIYKAPMINGMGEPILNGMGKELIPLVNAVEKLQSTTKTKVDDVSLLKKDFEALRKEFELLQRVMAIEVSKIPEPHKENKRRWNLL